eukprot:3369779-Rhodomonas_salina.1
MGVGVGGEKLGGERYERARERGSAGDGGVAGEWELDGGGQLRRGVLEQRVAAERGHMGQLGRGDGVGG